jgi:hypothetical protein
MVSFSAVNVTVIKYRGFMYKVVSDMCRIGSTLVSSIFLVLRSP